MAAEADAEVGGSVAHRGMGRRTPLENHVADAVVSAQDPLRARSQGTSRSTGGNVRRPGRGEATQLQTDGAVGPHGEQVLLQVESPAVLFKTMPELGMPKPIADTLAQSLTLEKGLLVVSSPAGSGLSTTFDVVVSSADRLLRDFDSIEDAAAPPREIQNVKPVRFDARANITPVAASRGRCGNTPPGSSPAISATRIWPSNWPSTPRTANS